MVKAEICTAGDAPLEQVIDQKNTTRFVRKPSIQPCFLSVRTTEEVALVVEIDSHVVGTHQLRTGLNHIPLNMLAQPVRSRILGLGSRLTGHGRTAQEPRMFTVLIRRGSPEGELLATYKYVLLSEAEYDATYAQASEVQAPVQQARYTTDARSVDGSRNCWHCGKPIVGQCCAQCGCEQDEDDGEEAN
ncbi:MAG TPA: hypothetical protein V6C81_29150 [Planktothrix sp.]|jgi:hypothetical protein